MKAGLAGAVHSSMPGDDRGVVADMPACAWKGSTVVVVALYGIRPTVGLSRLLEHEPTVLGTLMFMYRREDVAVAVKLLGEDGIKNTIEGAIDDHETGGMSVGFAGTRYDTFLDRISNQKGSYLEFTKIVGGLKRNRPDASFDDVSPVIRDFFGLEVYPAQEMEQMRRASAAGDVRAIEKLKYALQPYEVDRIKKALAMSWTPRRERPADDFYYMNYGVYEPLSVAMTQILNNKAGIGWTTFSHSGLPTPVSAVGVGAEAFVGHYDNTDIFRKIVSIAY